MLLCVLSVRFQLGELGEAFLDLADVLAKQLLLLALFDVGSDLLLS